MESFKYYTLRSNIRNLIQNSEMDIGSVYYIMKDIYHELETQFYQQINKELTELENKVKNTTDNSDEKKEGD